MTDHSKEIAEIWKMLKETNKQMQETDRKMQETDRKMQETDRQMKETDKKLDKTIKGIDKLENIVGGIGNSNGFFAEDIFFNSFKKKMSLGDITFDSVDRNVSRFHKGLEDEFDIVLTNSDSLTIIEVKYNFHPNDVKSVFKKIKNYRILFPNYQNYTIYGAIAALTMSNRTIQLAKKFGFFALTLAGQKLKILNDQVEKL